MKKSDFDAFVELLDATSLMLSRNQYAPSEVTQVMFFNALAAYSLEQVRAAFDAHCRDPKNGRFAPLPADIIGKIEEAAAADGRPEADEAWAVALASTDEQRTVVWTAETAEAWSACRPVLQSGDKVGARMAFKAAYDRLLGEARAARRPVQWSVSLGHDPEQRQLVLTEAVRAGRLPEAMLPAPAGPVAGLLELAGTSACPPSVMQRLRAFAADVRAGITRRSAAELDRERTAALKAEAAAKVAAHMGA